MLRSIVICPDENLAERLQSAIEQTGQATVQKILSRYPTAIELVRTIRAHNPAAIFLSFVSTDEARGVVALLEAEASHIAIVAIITQSDEANADGAVLRESMRSGIREFVAAPFAQADLREALNHVAAQIKRKPAATGGTNKIFSFLPSKAGAGTSTIALNVSAAFAAKPDTRVLLSDFDLNSGMMRFLLKLENERSVTDAIEHSSRMDENLWPQMVTELGNLHVLHAGRTNPGLRIDNTQIRALIGFMRNGYQALCFDLSGNLEKYSLEIMRESKRVLMVCTPEKSSLLMAREKLELLETLELEGRVSVVLNRYSKKPLFTVPEVEQILKVPVLEVFPNDYTGVNNATHEATWVASHSELGKKFAHFADVLLEREQAEKAPEKKRFLEYFELFPAKRAV